MSPITRRMFIALLWLAVAAASVNLMLGTGDDVVAPSGPGDAPPSP